MFLDRIYGLYIERLISVVVPERAGTAFRQIFCSRNDVPANTYVTCRNAGAVAFRQIGIEQYELNSRCKFSKYYTVFRQATELVKLVNCLRALALSVIFPLLTDSRPISF